MAALSRDVEATKSANFTDHRSKICLNGNHFYYGRDATRAYNLAYALWAALGRICAICKRPVRGKPDWEHKVPKGSKGYRRDDHPRNRQFTHSMRAKEPCHRAKHNREVRLKWIA